MEIIITVHLKTMVPGTIISKGIFEGTNRTHREPPIQIPLGTNPQVSNRTKVLAEVIQPLCLDISLEMKAGTIGREPRGRDPKE